MKKTFYVTNAIPYVNAAPHIGHALEFVQSDAIKRYHRDVLGEQTLLLCGGDENALKNVQAAQAAGQEVQQFVDKNTTLFEELAKNIDVEFDVFQKGSNSETHYPASQKLWNLCEKNGDIYKKKYSGLYCVGCETFYTEDELNENGECFEHPGKKLETVEEENYFFNLKKYQEKIKELIESDTIKIVPHTRKNEVTSFLEKPLIDISISRSNERARNWGVPVPGDDKQRMYVWFDALNIYQSGVGFGWNDKKYGETWPADVHVIGKGIIRFHAVYWIAFLLSAGLKLPKSIFVHGYITVEGQKMSKTIGNVIDPNILIEKYGVDALRYYFLREIPAYGDGDFSEDRFRELYNADLANGLGNVVARITKLASGATFSTKEPKLRTEYKKAIEEFRFNDTLASTWDLIRELDRYINDKQPWTLKDKPELPEVLSHCIESLQQIVFELQPFLPRTARTIAECITGSIQSPPILFPRIK